MNAARRAASRTGADERAATLHEPGWEFWSALDLADDQRAAYLTDHVHKPYMQIIQEFYDSADTCVERYAHLRRRHEVWRHIVILGTGFVAIVNAAAAFFAGRDGPGEALLTVGVSFATGAALLAVILAILANLENFGNYLERAHAYREARELYLDAARDFDRLWQTHVIPFWPRPEACVNARELYRRISVKDSELRRKVKDLTQPRSGHGGS